MSTRNYSAIAQRNPRVLPLSTEELNGPAPVIFSPSVFDSIQRTVGAAKAETGGMLGGKRHSSVVEDFFLDDQGAMTATTYYPDMVAVNNHLKTVWNPAGVNLLGFVHSHPGGSTSPSMPDFLYSQRILSHVPPMGTMLLPIVQSAAGGGVFEVHPWVVKRTGPAFACRPARMEVKPPQQLDSLSEFPEYARVEEAYDLTVMVGSRVVAVGCGGSAQFLEDLARTGVGEFVLIDPDVIEPANVGTQQVSISDIGLPKVEALARRITEASPHARVLTVQASSDDLTDEGFARLINAPFPGSTYHLPTAALLCAFTDSFPAQARTARIGLHLGVPVLTATVYREGRGVELSFACAGLTPACIRCALSSRYRQYLEEEFENDVTSHGTPLWVTARLNSMKTPIALALLHRVSSAGDAAHPAAARAERFLRECGQRNLVVVSLDSNPVESLNLTMFEGAASSEQGALLSDLALWRQPRPDDGTDQSAACPDCGGFQDFDRVQGTFLDTRRPPLLFGDHRFPQAAGAALQTDPQPPLSGLHRIFRLAWGSRRGSLRP